MMRPSPNATRHRTTFYRRDLSVVVAVVVVTIVLGFLGALPIQW